MYLSVLFLAAQRTPTKTTLTKIGTKIKLFIIFNRYIPIYIQILCIFTCFLLPVHNTITFPSDVLSALPIAIIISSAKDEKYVSFSKRFCSAL